MDRHPRSFGKRRTCSEKTTGNRSKSAKYMSYTSKCRVEWATPHYRVYINFSLYIVYVYVCVRYTRTYVRTYIHTLNHREVPVRSVGEEDLWRFYSSARNSVVDPSPSTRCGAAGAGAEAACSSSCAQYSGSITTPAEALRLGSTTTNLNPNVSVPRPPLSAAIRRYPLWKQSPSIRRAGWICVLNSGAPNRVTLRFYNVACSTHCFVCCGFF